MTTGNGSDDSGAETDDASNPDHDGTPDVNTDDTEGEPEPTSTESQAASEENTTETSDEEQVADTGEGDEDSQTESGLAKIRASLTRRHVIGTVALLLVVVLVLLLVFVPTSLLALAYSPSAEFQAEPAAVEADALSAHGYELVEQDTLIVEQDRTILGADRTIITANQLRNYERTVDVQGTEFDAAIFTVVTTPAIKVGRSPANPVADMSHKAILTDLSNDLEGGYDDLGNLERVDGHTGVLLGQETRVSQFKTTVEQRGGVVDVYLYVTVVESDDDLVVAVGGHPAPFAQERLSIFELLENVSHPATK